MKKSIAAALVLVACLLLAPFGFGKLAERRVNAALDVLVEQVPYLVISDRTWQGGWFKSHQEVTFDLAPAFRSMLGGGGDEAASGFKVFNDVVHGPVLGAAGFGLGRVDTTFDLPEEMLVEVRKLFGPEPPVQIRSRLGFIGGGTTTVSSKGRTIRPEGEEFEISYEDSELVMGFGKNADKYTMKGGLPRIELKADEGGGLLLTGLTMTGHGERVLGKLYDSESDMRLGGLKFADPAKGQDFSIADLHYVAGMDSKDGFSAVTAKIGSGAVDHAQVKALGLDISEIHYDMSFRHLHSETLEKLLGVFADMYSATPAAGTDPAAAMSAVQEQVIGPMMEHAQELLRHDPEFGLDRLGMVTPEGEAVVRGLIKFKGVTIDDFSPMGYMNLLGKIDADITVEIAQALADKIPNGAMVLGMAVSQGYVTRDGEKLVCHIEFRNGELKVNGKAQAIPIPGMGAPPPGGVPLVPEA